MAAVIRIPKIGIGVTEAMLAEWFVKDGDQIEKGSSLYSIEMDKSTNEIEAPISGRVQIIGPAGLMYQVGDLVGRIYPE